MEVVTKGFLRRQEGNVSLQIFPVVWIFLKSQGAICYDINP